MHDAQARLTGLADRQRAFARLLHALSGSSQPAGPLYLHIDGPAGSGKSAVLDELAHLFANDPAREWTTVSIDASRLGTSPPTGIAGAIFASLRRKSSPVPAVRLRIRECLLRFPAVISNRTAGWLLLLILLPLVLSSRPEVIAVGIGLALVLLGAVVYAALALPADSIARTAAQVRKTCTGKPLAVLVDNLDRGDAVQVEQVLDTLETLLQGCTGAIFVAADRRWLLTSAEETRKPYREPMAIPGRSLGYQILARRFDLSLSLPVNWNLSSIATPLTPEEQPPPSAAIERVLDSSPRLRSRHRLAVQALEPICSRPELPRTQLETWVLLALRWPSLAEFLVAHPARIAHFRYDQQPSEASPEVGLLFTEPEITALLRAGQQLVLDESAVRKLCAPFSATWRRVPVA